MAELNGNNLMGKRFLFASLAVICVSGVTSYLKFDGLTYIKLIGIITGIFTIGQTITDSIKK